MMAAAFSAFTVEAFLNHLGSKRLPEWNRIEWQLGPKDKLRLIKKKLALSIDLRRRPFSTFPTMLRVRNALAHGRTVAAVSMRSAGDLGDWPEPEWKQLCRADLVARMVEDAEKIVREISELSGSRRNPFGSMGSGWSVGG
jgi:hypothetical protein